MNLNEIFGFGQFDKFIKATEKVNHFKAYTIKDNKIIVTDDFNIYDSMLDKDGAIAMPIESVDGCIWIYAKNFKSFKNIPRKLTAGPDKERCFFVDKTAQIDALSLEGFPPIIEGYVNFFNCSNMSFTNIDKHIHECEKFILNPNHKGPLLSFLKIKNLTELSAFYYNGPNVPIPPCTKACEIITKHLRTKQRDILECKEELVENNLKEFAKL